MPFKDLARGADVILTSGLLYTFSSLRPGAAFHPNRRVPIPAVRCLSRILSAVAFWSPRVIGSATISTQPSPAEICRSTREIFFQPGPRISAPRSSHPVNAQKSPGTTAYG